MAVENSLINDFKKSPAWQKFMLLLILICILYFTLTNVIFYGSTKELAELKRTYKEQKLSINSCKDLNLEIAKMEKELSKTTGSQKTMFITKENYPILISQLTTKHVADVKINSIRPGNEGTQDKYLTKELYISCEGTLSGLKQFYDGIKSVLLSSSVTSITINKKDEKYYTSEVFITSYLIPNKKPILNPTVN